MKGTWPQSHLSQKNPHLNPASEHTSSETRVREDTKPLEISVLALSRTTFKSSTVVKTSWERSNLWERTNHENCGQRFCYLDILRCLWKEQALCDKTWSISRIEAYNNFSMNKTLSQTSPMSTQNGKNVTLNLRKKMYACILHAPSLANSSRSPPLRSFC